MKTAVEKKLKNAPTFCPSGKLCYLGQMFENFNNPRSTYEQFCITLLKINFPRLYSLERRRERYQIIFTLGMFQISILMTKWEVSFPAQVRDWAELVI